jgi:hypothetical protein
MDNSLLEQAEQLQQDLIDFCFEAEGDLATALETYVGEQSRLFGQRYNATFEQALLIDSFITEGQVDQKTPIDLFVEQHPELSPSQQTLLKSWKNSFLGVFAVQEVTENTLQLMNWLTTKTYTVAKPTPISPLTGISRLQPGEIILTRIAPLEATWIFSGSYLELGALGKPKLAVAIGNFKQLHPHHLYGDAPELLAQAWESVEKYHEEFVNHFGRDEVTLPGYQLNRELKQLQENLQEKLLSAAGVDKSQSPEEIAQQAGLTPDAMAEMREKLGGKAEEAEPAKTPKMMLPNVELPNELEREEPVTALSHPRWGQMFLGDYPRLTALLEQCDGETKEELETLVSRNLPNPEMNAYVWQRLAQAYPQQLEMVLQRVLQRPDFTLAQLDQVLHQQYDKPLEPTLPEIASVPLHLHHLFQEAFAEVNQSKKRKGKKKKKSSAGFGT